MTKCWKAMVKSDGGGEWHLSRRHNEGHVTEVGKINEGTPESSADAEQSMSPESLWG